MGLKKAGISYIRKFYQIDKKNPAEAGFFVT